jgi:hypothetical protein
MTALVESLEGKRRHPRARDPENRGVLTMAKSKAQAGNAAAASQRGGAKNAATIAPDDVGSYRPTLPAQSVAPRWEAVVDLGTVNVIEDAALKENTLPSRPGYPSGMSNLQTRLHVEAWVRNATYTKSVWVDLHVFGLENDLLHAETLPLHYTRSADDTADVFVLDQTLYQGSVASEGSVSPKPDAHTVQYRLYGELGGQVFTDGVLHECFLKEDTEFNG